MEFKDNKAIYYQISDLICENILLNKFPEGERLISVREMAGNLQVNPNTVMRAYSFLQEENIIFNKRGIGYFIADNGKEIVMKLKKDAFIKTTLPVIFKECDLYGVGEESLLNLYREYLKGESDEVK